MSETQCDGQALRHGWAPTEIAMKWTYAVRMSGILLLAMASSAQSQELTWTKARNPVADYYGGGLSIANDWNGDGVPEVLIGAYGTDCGIGDDGDVEVCDGSSGALLLGWCGSNDAAGAWVVPVRDLDGDGKDDLVIGCPLYDDPAGPRDAGRVVLISSSTGGAMWELLGEGSGDHFGSPIIRLGDLDGDGFDEILISSPSQGTLGLGRVYLVSTTDGGVIRSHTGTTTSEKLGEAITKITDVDGDGVDDYAASTKTTYDFNRGRIDVFSGESGALLWTKTGEKFQGLGGSMCDAGDWDHDGHGDLLAWVGIGDGALRIYSPATDQLLFERDYQHVNNTLDSWGYVLNRLGDLDADGFVDFAVSAYTDAREFNDTGRVDLYSGRTMRPLYHLYPDTLIRGWFGRATAGERDLTGDGIPDLVVGAPAERHSKPGGGTVFVYALNDLYLMTDVGEPLPGDTVVVDLRAGPPGLLGLLVLTDVSGTPTFDPLLLAPFDANGELQLTADVNTSVSGLDFTIRGYAQNRNGRGPLMDSIDVTVSVK